MSTSLLDVTPIEPSITCTLLGVYIGGKLNMSWKHLVFNFIFVVMHMLETHTASCALICLCC